MAAHRLLFVAGVGRSGTTVLTELLSVHPAIAIGMERYKARFRPGATRSLDRSSFDAGAFFDFSDGDTNITPAADERWRAYYEALERKWGDARYVGDKVTHTRIRRLWHDLPETRFVCIARDIHSVAASWQVRADNPADVNWSATRGAEAAVAPWNKSLAQVARAQTARPDLVAVVEYDRLYSDPEATSLRRVVGWLGLDWSDDLGAAFDRVHRRYVDVLAPRERTLTAEQRAHIDEQADDVRWKRLVRRAF